MAPSSLNVLALLPLSEAQRTRLEAGAPGARYAYVAPAPGPMLGSASPSVSPSATRCATRPRPSQSSGLQAKSTVAKPSSAHDVATLTDATRTRYCKMPGYERTHI